MKKEAIDIASFFVLSGKVQFWGNVKFLRNIAPCFLSLTDAFGQQIFDLTVDRAKIILCPSGKSGIEWLG